MCGWPIMDGVQQGWLAEADGHPILPRDVRRAVAYMRDNIAEKITLAGLASACYVSERTLLKHFRRFVGLSPLACLHRLRLNAARGELTNALNKDAISDIAIRCGFSHFGRFAADYRRLFNETPSATRRRVRAQASARFHAEADPRHCDPDARLLSP